MQLCAACSACTFNLHVVTMCPGVLEVSTFHPARIDIRHKRGWEQLLDNENVHLLLSTYYASDSDDSSGGGYFLACGGGGDFVLPNTSTQLERLPFLFQGSLLLDLLIQKNSHLWCILELGVCGLTNANQCAYQCYCEVFVLILRYQSLHLDIGGPVHSLVKAPAIGYLDWSRLLEELYCTL